MPLNACQLSPWGRIVRCLQLAAVRERQESCDNSFPQFRVGQESCDNSFPRLRMGQESRDFPSRGSAWDKNRATIPSRGSAWDKNRVIFLPAAPREARIVPRNLAAIRERQESCRETFPTSDLGQETVFLASRRVVWSKKRAFLFPSARRGYRLSSMRLMTTWADISLLAASGMTRLRGLSITSSVTMRPRRTGRQCMK